MSAFTEKTQLHGCVEPGAARFSVQSQEHHQVISPILFHHLQFLSSDLKHEDRSKQPWEVCWEVFLLRANSTVSKCESVNSQRFHRVLSQVFRPYPPTTHSVLLLWPSFLPRLQWAAEGSHTAHFLQHNTLVFPGQRQSRKRLEGSCNNSLIK